jgi:LysR family transcriptional regulator, hca operon transcriptional activator
MRIDARLLIYFAAVADRLSFIEAARDLNISQPWLSKQIQKLEGQLGCTLFERSTRHVELSSAGLSLLSDARAVSAHTTAIGEKARTLRAEQHVRLRVGVAIYALFVERRTELIDLFIRHYPGVPLETVVAPTAQLLSQVKRGNLDIAFAMPPDESQAAAGLDGLMVCEGGIDIVLPKNDSLCGHEIITGNQLGGRTMAVFSRSANGELFRMLFDRFQNHGVDFCEYSDQSFFRHLSRDHLFTALPEWQPSPIGGYVRRPLAGAESELRLQVYKGRGPGRRELDNFWHLARQSLRHPGTPLVR